MFLFYALTTIAGIHDLGHIKKACTTLILYH